MYSGKKRRQAEKIRLIECASIHGVADREKNGCVEEKKDVALLTPKMCTQRKQWKDTPEDPTMQEVRG